MRWLWSELGAGRIDAVIRGAGVVIVAGVLATGAYVVGGGGEAGEAHAFVNADVSGDTCTRSSTPVTFEEAQAANDLCGTFQAAYNVASCGDTILVKEGAYDGQKLIRNATLGDSCSGTPVVIAAAVGEQVTLDDNSAPDTKSIQVGRASGSERPARDLILRGFTLVGGIYFYPGSRRITLDEAVAQTAFIRCGHDITISNSEFTDPEATGVPTFGPADTFTIATGEDDLCPSSSTAPSGIIVEDSYFHEIWRPDGSSAHRECLHIMGADGLIVRRNRFHECLGSTAAISINEDGTTTMEGIVIENNSFWRTYDGGDVSPGPTGEGPAVNIGGGGTCAETAEVTIRFNTLYESGDFSEQACPTGAGIIIDSNVFEGGVPTCASPGDQYTWRYNVAESGSWSASCDDGNNAVGDVAFADASNGDLNLASGSFAVGKGNPSSPPSTDREGTTRPQGAAPDAGMDEKE